MGLATSPFPFVEDPTPHGAENDDAGHVQRPTGKTVSSHLGLAHGVEKELEVPNNPREGTEEIVVGHRNAQRGGGDGWDPGAGDLSMLAGAGGFRGVFWADGGGEVLISALVFTVEMGAPDKISGKSSQEDNDEFG